jgi:hypothetical protein
VCLVTTTTTTTTAAAVFLPKLVFLGEFTWGYTHVNPAAYPVLYGIAGNMMPGKAVTAALVLTAAVGVAPQIVATIRARPAAIEPSTLSAGRARAEAGSAPGLRTAAAFRVTGALAFAALLTGLTIAAYRQQSVHSPGSPAPAMTVALIS